MRKRTEQRPGLPHRVRRMRPFAGRASVRRPAARPGSLLESQIAAELSVIAERRTAN